MLTGCSAGSPPIFVSAMNPERSIEIMEDTLSHANLTLDAILDFMHQTEFREEIDLLRILDANPQLIYDIRSDTPMKKSEEEELIDLFSEEKLQKMERFSQRRKALERLLR